MLTRTKQKMFFVIILVLLELMAPKASAIKLTLSDEGLMALDETLTIQSITFFRNRNSKTCFRVLMLPLMMLSN